MSTDNNSRGSSVIACSIATVSVASVIVILRLLTRGKLLNIVGYEDWFILVSLLFSIGNTVGMCFQVEYGLGRHMASLTSEDIINFLKGFYFTVIFYNVSTALSKLSILLLYYRIFGISDIRRACQVMLAIVTLYGIELFFTAVFVCVPVAHWWDPAHVSGVCLANTPLWYTNVSMNIILDVTIVLLPMRIISGLVLPRKQKFGLYLIFALGFFVCIMSILRLHWLIVASDSTDPTWDNIGIANWSCIELNVAIICPCLTTLKPLLSHFFPRIFSSRSASSNVYDNYGEGVDAESNKAISKSSSATDSRQKSSKPDYGIEIDEHSIDDCSLGSLQPVIIHPGRETMHV